MMMKMKLLMLEYPHHEVILLARHSELIFPTQLLELLYGHLEQLFPAVYRALDVPCRFLQRLCGIGLRRSANPRRRFPLLLVLV